MVSKYDLPQQRKYHIVKVSIFIEIRTNTKSEHVDWLVVGGAGSSSHVLQINEEFNVSFNPNQLRFSSSWIGYESCPKGRLKGRRETIGHKKE